MKTTSQQIAMVLTALAEGLDASAAERIFGYRQATITTWLTRAGEHAQTLHERFFCHLRLPHLQLDELRTRLRCAKQVLWLWLAIDPCTKILPVLQLGPRTQHMAHLLIHSLRRSLAPGCLPLFTSDGLNLYFYALTAHFGHWLEVGRRGRNVRQWQVAAGLIYGQVKKSYRRRKLVRVTHVMRLGARADLKVALQRLGFSGRLNTAFIERVNLTVRHGVSALARRTWATAKPAPHLLAHLEWWRAYYHFVRPHAAYTNLLRPGITQLSPELKIETDLLNIDAPHHCVLEVTLPEKATDDGRILREALDRDWYVLEGDGFGLPHGPTWIVPKRQQRTRGGALRVHGRPSFEETIVPLAEFTFYHTQPLKLQLIIQGRLIKDVESQATLQVINYESWLVKDVAVEIPDLEVAARIPSIGPEATETVLIHARPKRSGHLTVKARIASLGGPFQWTDLSVPVEQSDAERLLGEDRVAKFFDEEEL